MNEENKTVFNPPEFKPDPFRYAVVRLAIIQDTRKRLKAVLDAIKAEEDQLKKEEAILDAEIRELAMKHHEVTGDKKVHPIIQVQQVERSDYLTPENVSRAIQNGATSVLKVKSEYEYEIVDHLLSSGGSEEWIAFDKVALKKLIKSGDAEWAEPHKEVVKQVRVEKSRLGEFLILYGSEHEEKAFQEGMK